MDNKEPKFNITMANIIPFVIYPMFIFCIIAAILDDLSFIDTFCCILVILIGVLFWTFMLTLFDNAVLEDINILRYIWAKIKYFYFHYLLGKKLYTFKYKKYDSPDIIYNRFKRKKEKEKIFPARQFLRFSHNKFNRNPVFANKFCIVSIDYKNKQIAYFDKISQTGYRNNNEKYSIEEKTLKNIFNSLCKSFSFDTTVENVIEIIKSYLYINFQNIDQSVDYNNMSLNSMSVAALANLPGMNLGKANKLHSYYKSNYIVHNIDEFISIAEIKNEDNKIKLRKIFGNGINCNVKNLNEINYLN